MSATPIETVQLSRRGFLKGMAGILAAGVAPAVIGSEILMPVRKLWTPAQDIILNNTANYSNTLWLSVTMEDGLGRVWRHDFNPPVRADKCPEVVFPCEQPVRLSRSLVTVDPNFKLCIGMHDGGPLLATLSKRDA